MKQKIEEKLKKNMKSIMIFVFFISLAFVRFMVSKYGEDSRTIIAGAGLLIAILGFIYTIYIRKYLAAIVVFSMILPCIIIAIGMYINNDIISVIGFVLIPILVPLTGKIVNNHIEK